MNDVVGVQIAHPIAQPFRAICCYAADGPDSRSALTRSNGILKDSVDVSIRSLKVATRVQIPLGLPNDLDPVGWTTDMRVWS
jgi:hypothetical protein